MKAVSSMDAYIADYPPETQKILKKLRALVHEHAPEASEKISYGIPCFSLNGRHFIYIAGYPAHVSIYPLRRGVAPFDKELEPYHSGTATVKFPLNKPIPWPLVRKIVAFMAKQHLPKHD